MTWMLHVYTFYFVVKHYRISVCCPGRCWAWNWGEFSRPRINSTLEFIERKLINIPKNLTMSLLIAFISMFCVFLTSKWQRIVCQKYWKCWNNHKQYTPRIQLKRINTFRIKSILYKSVEYNDSFQLFHQWIREMNLVKKWVLIKT